LGRVRIRETINNAMIGSKKAGIPSADGLSPIFPTE
jgi:hypothetical protein